MRKTALLFFGLVTVAIVALGLVVLSSASGANGLRLHKDAYFFMKRQFVYLAVGLIVCTVTALVDYRIWRRQAWLLWTLFGITILLLLAVFPPIGRAINGSYRWINLGFFNLQPSELAKLVTVLVVAFLVNRAAWRVDLFSHGALPAYLCVGALALPVLFEPDFGSTLVIGLVAVLVMYVGGIKIMHFLPLGFLGFGGLVYRVIENPNRMARIAAWMGVKMSIGTQVADAAAKNAEYQGDMALAAIGNGGLWGVGLNQSMQKHYYLPEAHTDMIFAIGAEELGIIFSVGTLLLFCLFFAFSIHIARKASDPFGRLLVVGMAFVIFFAAIFNIGVVCEALPMKGMALPFFSYGGTNMISAFFAVGTILSVGIHSYRDRKRKLMHG